jgi:hypothetical protein
MKCHFNSKNECNYISIHNLNEKINNIHQYPLLSLLKNDNKLLLNYFINKKKNFYEKIFHRNIIYNNNILHINIILPNKFDILYIEDDTKKIEYMLYLKYIKVYPKGYNYIYNINDYIMFNAKVITEKKIRENKYFDKILLKIFDY